MTQKSIHAEIFKTILSRFLEAFSPHIIQVLAEFNEQVEQSARTSDRVLIDLFKVFPRGIKSYVNTLKSLREFAGSAPDLIVSTISKLLKECIKSGRGSSISIIAQEYDQTNPNHALIIYYFSLILFSDLLVQILSYNQIKDSIPTLARTGFIIATTHSKEEVLDQMVIRQWSVIFSIISETDFQAVSQVFTLFSPSDYDSAFLLFRFIRLDADDAFGCVFMDQLIQLVKQLIRKRQITPLILKCLPTMALTIQFNEELLGRLFDAVYSLRYDRSLSINSLELIVVLLLRLPKQISKLNDFFSRYIVPHPNNIEAIDAFEALINGRNCDPVWLFWEWGDNPRSSRLAYLKWNGLFEYPQSDQRSITSLFMNNFFTRSKFNLFPERFSNLLLHIAALDFPHFLSAVLPTFLSLDSNDPRFLTLLMIVPYVNSEHFITFAYKPATPELISSFNLRIRQRLLPDISILKECNGHGINIRESDFYVKSIIEEADQRVENMLEEWKVDNMTQLTKPHIYNEQYESAFTLRVQVVNALEFIFIEDDFKNEETIKQLIHLSSDSNTIIASTCYKLCQKKYVKPDLLPLFLRTLIHEAGKVANAEHLFVTLSFIKEILGNVQDLSNGNLLMIEFIGFFGLSAVYPNTRGTAYKILEICNERLDGTGVISIIMPHVSGIEQFAKMRILRQIIPDSPNTVVIPNGSISIQDAMLSHYFDVWVYFLAEIQDLVIGFNYLPILNAYTFISDASIDSSLRYIKRQLRSPFFMMYFNLKYIPQYLDISNAPRSDNVLERTTPNESREELLNKLQAFIGNDEYCHDIMIALKNVNISHFPIICELFQRVTDISMPDAADVLSYAIKSPWMSSKLIRLSSYHLFSFIAIMGTYFIKKDYNSTRTIQWTDSLENKLDTTIIINYCTITIKALTLCPKIKDEDWSLSARQIMFQFLTNWAITKTERLSSLREYAKCCLSTVIKSGPIFSDGLMVTESTMDLFLQLEDDAVDILLSNHFELLVDKYIRAYYTRKNGEVFLRSIFKQLRLNTPESITIHGGQLMLLVLVIHESQNPHSKEYIDDFMKKAYPIVQVTEEEMQLFQKEADKATLMPRFLHPATELIFQALFEVLCYKNLQVSTRDLCGAIKPWVSNIRLLPSQSCIARGVTKLTNVFTPFQFLCRLMKVTEQVQEFSPVAGLWIELMKSPDHVDIIPVFITEWNNTAVKQRLFTEIFESDIEAAIARFGQYCSFGSYTYNTYKKGKFLSAFDWIDPIVANIAKVNWEKMRPYVKDFLHFTIMMKAINPAHSKLFDLFIHRFEVESPEIGVNEDNICFLVRQLVPHLSDEELDAWGNQALQYILASKELSYTTISLAIYNELMRPIDRVAIVGICRTVHYYLQFGNQKELLKHAFNTMSKVVNIKPEFSNIAVPFVSAFLDCPVYMDVLANGMTVFQRSVKLTDYQKIIKIVRPLLTRFEWDKASREILNDLIDETHSEELMMIVAPLKRFHSDWFPSSEPVEFLLAKVSSSVLSKSLEHYQMIIQNATRMHVDSILWTSTYILQKASEKEISWVSASWIYKVALHSIVRCPNALPFLTAVSKRKPEVLDLNVNSSFEWERSLESVVAEVKRVVDGEEPPQTQTVTDCSSYHAVAGFLSMETLPRILPFATLQEMLDAMARVKLPSHRRAMAIKRSPALQNVAQIGNEIRQSFKEAAKVFKSMNNIEPLQHPKKLLIAPDKFGRIEQTGLTISVSEFVEGL